MIPILFDSNETSFTSNGIGRLVDCISCTVTEERNGIFECEFQYPANGRYFDELIQGGVIGITHDDTGDIQPFDIYKHSAVISGVVTFNARHISYRLCGIVVKPYTATSCAAALAGIKTNSVQTNDFTFTTDKSISKTFESTLPKSARNLLMGEEGSVLQSFQGEYKFDKWNVSLLTSRGSDTGVTVRYGKNLTGITWERDDSNCFNAVAPFWTDGTTTVTLPETYVQPTTPISPVICVPLDMSQMIEGQPTEAQLRAAAISYLDTTEPWKPFNKITVDFVAMWQSPEYEAVASIQRIGLCDTVSIYWTEMGIVAEKAKVVRTVYNTLAERFDEIQVGSISTEFVAITTDTANSDNNIVYPLNIEKGGTGANNATDALANLGLGNLGGALAIDPDAVSVPSGTATEVGSYTFSPGTYVIVGAARFASNATGYRRLQFFAGVNTSAVIAEDVNTMAVNGMYTFLQITCVRKFTVSTPMRLMATQTSGSAMSVTGRIKFLRIL